MIDPLDKRYRPFLLFLKRKRRGAFFVLTLEKAIHHTWRLIFWCLFFTGLWMLALPSFLGTTASILALLTFLLGIGFFIRNDVLKFSFPNPENIDSRLETNSHLGRGHIALIEDQLANPAIISTRLLWHKAQRDGLFRLKTLHIPRPNPNLSKKDPHALRFIALMVFISGAFVSGHHWKERIINGLIPVTPTLTFSQTQKSTDLWIKPPDYTQMQEIHISGKSNNKETLNIPEGSTYRIRMRNRLGKILTPHLHMGKSNLPLTYMEGNLYGIEGTFKPGEVMRITQGLLPHTRWPYHYIIDTPPEIRSDIKNEKEIEAEIETTKELRTSSRYDIMDNNQIRFPLVVKDDYGVKELHMHLRLDEIVEDAPLGEDTHEVRLIMSKPKDEFKIAPIYDMTGHIWAGLPVTVEFTATDQKGQSTSLDKIHLTLPERNFEHPLAKKLIAARKTLAWNYKSSFRDISIDLEKLLNHPEQFQNNLAVFLAIRSASSRLYHNDKKPEKKRLKSAKEVIKLLWETALVIEEGDMALALRELRDAQRELDNALRDPNIGEQEIRNIMDNLRQKMADYFTEVHREMQKRIAQGENIPFMTPEDFGTMITPNTLANLMAQIEQATREGDEQKARELMSQLQRMMEMIDPNKGAMLPRDMQTMRETINELQELIEDQEALIKKTEKQTEEQQARSKNKNDNKKINTDKNKAEQEALRHALGQLMLDVDNELGKIPENMGKAEQEMRSSAQKLGKNNPSMSLPHQKNAVQHLKNSQENMNQQFRERMQQMIGIGLSATGQQLDPLGRPYDNNGNGKNTDSSIKIPDESQKKRVDDIIRQIRRRSGDRDRSREELEYYRRLLRQF